MPLDPQTIALLEAYKLGCFEVDGHFLPKVASYVQSLAKTLPSLTAPLISDRPNLNATLLTKTQQEVIESGFERRLSLILGGPGTGKTYTAGVLLSHLMKEGISIGCAAPTGKAAERLKESLFKSSKAEIESRTLHSILGIGRNPHDVPSSLPYDLLVVDEASMISPHLFTLLLEKIPPHGRLLLIGDPDQLPPVEGGSLFTPLSNLYLKNGWTKRLDASHRTDNPLLLAFAESIRNGDIEHFEALFTHFHSSSKEPPSGTRILTPLREGPSGVEEMNRRMFQRAIKKGERKFPILLTKNAPSLGLWNGELGIIELQQETPLYDAAALRWQKGAKAFVGGTEWAPTALPPFELAYALTIHKAQGSEEEAISLLIPEKAPLTRPLLYTAVTRAKKELTLYGAKDPLLEALRLPLPQHRTEILFPSL